ncbi:MAG: IclR family transcriptional regulator [Betaproteobacteria bacterium]|jgi:DNA-binding IclR family transcriptional regulator
MSSDSSIKSADRVLDVLEFLSRRGNSASHSEIAYSLNIPKSSLTGILKNLADRNYLKKISPDNTYSLGPAFFELLHLGKNSSNILNIAQLQLNWMTEKTKEASAFYLFKDTYVERVLGVEASYPLNYRVNSKVKFPLHSTAAGKAILNALSEEQLQLFFKQAKLDLVTNKTAINELDLRKRIKKDSNDGIMTSRSENTPGVAAFAVPVFGLGTKPLGALSIVVPEVRLTKELEKNCRASLALALEKVQHELLKGVSAE